MANGRTGFQLRLFPAAGDRIDLLFDVAEDALKVGPPF